MVDAVSNGDGFCMKGQRSESETIDAVLNGSNSLLNQVVLSVDPQGVQKSRSAVDMIS